MKEIEITTGTDVVSATLYESKNSHAVLVIGSATGVKQKFYQKFASYVAENGITAITFDYAGIGRSLKKPIKQLTNNAAHWGNDNLNGVIEYATSNYPKQKKLLLGHSIGGQLIGLTKSAVEMDKIILVAAQSGYWKYWQGAGKLKMWFNWYVLFPTMLHLFGYLPSKKISGMEDLPKNVAKQWSSWGKRPDYILGDPSIKEKFFDKIQSQITAFSIDDDEFAPKTAADWMAGRYLNADTKSIHLIPGDFEVSKIGHFGIFKDKFEATIWKLILDEMKI